MTEALTPPTEAWSKTIAHLAKTHVRRSSDKQSLATALMIEVRGKLRKSGHEAASLELNEATVAGWLLGTPEAKAPQTPAIHDALMEVLKLPKPVEVRTLGAELSESDLSRLALARMFGDAPPEDLAQHGNADFTSLLTGMGPEVAEASGIAPTVDERTKRRMELRQQLEASYAQIPDDAKILLTEMPEKPRAPRAVKVARAAAKSTIHDDPLLPERSFDAANYGRFEKADCTFKMAETENLHEYLTLYRLHQRQNIHGAQEGLQIFAEKLGIPLAELQAYESGKTLPGLAALEKYSAIMSGPDARHLQDLAISNRLVLREKLMAKCQRLDDEAAMMPLLERIDGIMSEMPKAYWLAQIERAHDPESFAARSNLPGWIEKMPQIECREDYLRAFRGYRGKSAQVVDYELRGEKVHTIALEASLENVDSKPGRALRDYLAKGDKLFDKKFYRDELASAFPEQEVEVKPEPKPKQSHVEKAGGAPVAKTLKSKQEPFNEFLGPIARAEQKRGR